MRKRKRAASKAKIKYVGNAMKSFHAAQKDNSKRQRRKIGEIDKGTDYAQPTQSSDETTKED